MKESRKLLDKQTAAKEKLQKTTRSHHRQDKGAEVPKLARRASSNSSEPIKH
jgi:hypothetical protein